jgi:hypothetical protein
MLARPRAGTSPARAPQRHPPVRMTEAGRRRTDQDPTSAPTPSSRTGFSVTSFTMSINRKSDDGGQTTDRPRLPLANSKPRSKDQTTNPLPSSVVRPPSRGGERIRTADPLLAKQVLSQLSYTPKPDVGRRTSDDRFVGDKFFCPLSSVVRPPKRLVGRGGFEPPTSRLSSARSNQLSYQPGSDVRRRMSDDGPRATELFPSLSSVLRRRSLGRDAETAAPQESAFSC